MHAGLPEAAEEQSDRREEWIPLELPIRLRLVYRNRWERVQVRLTQNISFSPRGTKVALLAEGVGSVRRGWLSFCGRLLARQVLRSLCPALHSTGASAHMRHARTRKYRRRRLRFGDAAHCAHSEELINARHGFAVLDLNQPSMQDGVFFVAFRRSDPMAQTGDSATRRVVNPARFCNRRSPSPPRTGQQHQQIF